MLRKIATLATTILICVPAAAQDQSAFYQKDYQQQALGIYRHLISIRSAAGHGKVPEVAHFLSDQFIDGGFDQADVHVLPLVVDTGEETASLVVRYRGSGASGKKPILFIAHMDVVDAKPDDWERDPFTLIEENGFFFGRGSMDNKFGITTLTTTFLRLKRAGFIPDRDLILGFTGDEETGMKTARALATTHRALTDAEYVLNADGGGGFLDTEGQPLGFLIQAAEKTYASFALTIRNPGGHSSMPREDNAIYELATVLKNVENHQFPPMINAITRRYFEADAQLAAEPVSSAMRAYAADHTNKDAQAILSAMPNQVGITRTTCVATMLEAGHAENALPQSATATVNCRIFPGVSVQQVQTTLLDVGANPNLEISVMGDPQASLVSPMVTEITDAVSKAVNDHYGEVPIIPYMAAYGTDGKEMRRANMPTYGVMGIFIRDEDVFAHGLNERVPVRSFFTALEYWDQIMRELGGTR